MHFQPFRFYILALVAVALVIVGAYTGTSAASASSSSIPVIDDSTLQAMTTSIGGGASPLPTTRTIPHWFGQTLDSHNGVTYGYNMVGADPNTCSGASCSATIQADITPVIVNIGGLTFSGNDVLAVTLASPQFATNDYGSTPAATAPGSFPGSGSKTKDVISKDATHHQPSGESDPSQLSHYRLRSLVSQR